MQHVTVSATMCSEHFAVRLVLCDCILVSSTSYLVYYRNGLNMARVEDSEVTFKNPTVSAGIFLSIGHYSDLVNKHATLIHLTTGKSGRFWWLMMTFSGSIKPQ